MNKVTQYGRIRVILPHGIEVSKEQIDDVRRALEIFKHHIGSVLIGQPECFYDEEIELEGTYVPAEEAKRDYFPVLGLPLDILEKRLILEVVDRKGQIHEIDTRVTKWKIVRKSHITLEFSPNVINGVSLSLIRILPRGLGGGPEWAAEKGWGVTGEWTEQYDKGSHNWQVSLDLCKLEFI